MSNLSPLFGRPEDWRPEWDQAYVVPWERIDGERIDQERMRRLWGKAFLARRAGVGLSTLTHAIMGHPFPGPHTSHWRGVRVDALHRIARALGIELADVVKP